MALGRRGLDPVASTIWKLTATPDCRPACKRCNRQSGVKRDWRAKSKGEDAEALIAEVNDIKQQMPQIEGEESVLAAAGQLADGITEPAQ